MWKYILFFSLWMNLCYGVEVKFTRTAFLNIHQNASRYSNVIATLSCNHPVQVIVEPKSKEMLTENMNEKWIKIKTGEYIGYVVDSFLATKKAECIQDVFPKFFDQLGLSLTDMYYWARLYDMFINERTQVK